MEEDVVHHVQGHVEVVCAGSNTPGNDNSNNISLTI